MIWSIIIVYIAGIATGVFVAIAFLQSKSVGTLEVKDVEDGGLVVGLSVNTDNLMKRNKPYGLVNIHKMEQSWATIDNLLRTEGTTKSRKLWIMHRLNEFYPKLETCMEDEAKELETRINNLEAELQELEKSN